jgi:AcrR family transcriptional regulator
MPRIIENPKQLILDTARSILLDKGYSELSMRNVAKDCGIAIGTIYNYYPTKKDLIIDMMSGYWTEYISILEKTIYEENAFFIKLHNIFKELKAFVNTFAIIGCKIGQIV